MKKFIIPILFLLPLSAFATAVPLSVSFSATPLFSEVNFLPGNEAIRTVGVSNNSGSPQDIIIEAINATSTGGLGDKLNLVIKEGDTPLYTGTLGAFLNAGEVSLTPSLPDGASITYSFGVTFESDAGNNLQNKTLGFDLCVGFSGGDKHCGDTVIGGEGDTGGGPTGGTGGTITGTGGGGGTSGGTHQLIISNEKAIVVDTTATITWDTNLLATSQVIFGLVSGGPYTLNLTPPNFGYPLYNAEDATKVISHSMLLTDLTPGQTYVYRVVSHASPPTISYEHEFTVPASLGTGNGNGTGGAIGEILGASFNPPADGNAASTTASTTSVSNGNNLAAAVTAGWSGLLSWWWFWILLILLAAYLFWRFVLKSKDEEI